MKTRLSLLCMIFLALSIIAQSPEKMSYQAVVFDSSNNLIVSQDIGMKISLIQSSIDGAIIYTETHSLSTNANGMVSLEIGTGASSDVFSSIDWSSGPYFIKTETDPTQAGGTNYTITGISQLLSVPYALYAKSAGSVTESDPVFTESLASAITTTDTANWNGKLERESDPTYSASAASGITTTDTANWNSKLDSESDPLFTAWDKSTGIEITEEQITDLDHFTNEDESDPVFSAWDKDYDDLTNKPTITNTQWTNNDDSIYFNTGYVGIGTSLPQTPLHIAQSQAGFYDALTLNNTANIEAGQGIRLRFQNSAYQSIVEENKSGYIEYGSESNYGEYGYFAFGTNTAGNPAAERLRITGAGNVGIGATSPQHKLVVAGNGWSQFITNTYANNPSASDNYGVYIGSNRSGGATEGNIAYHNYLTFAEWDGTTYSESMRIDPNGNVGIGTSSPGFKMSIVGPSAGTGIGSLQLSTPSLAQGERSSLSFSSTFQGTTDFSPRRTADIIAGFEGGSWGSEYLSLNVGYAGNANDAHNVTLEKMRIQANGNVGIGTTTPESKLEVAGRVTIDHAAAPGFYGQADNVNKVYVGYDGAGTGLQLYNFSSEKSLMVQDDGNLTYSGNVGIGTTTPPSLLSIVGGALTINSGFGNTTSRPAVGASRIAGEIAGTGSSFAADDGFLRLSAGGGSNSATKTFIDLSGYSTVSDMAYNIVFGTTGTESMRIDNSGNVGIGTSSPQEALDVNGVALSKFEGFSYYTSESTITADSWQSFSVPTLEYNTFSGSTYNTSTSAFTAPRSGYYRFSLFGYIITGTDGVDKRYAYGIEINGSLKSFAGGNFCDFDTPACTYSVVTYLNSGDVVNPAVFSTMVATIGGTSGGHQFYFQGEFVGK